MSEIIATAPQAASTELLNGAKRRTGWLPNKLVTPTRFMLAPNPFQGVKNGDPAKGETMTGAPLVVKDKVIVGVSGGEYGILGRVAAYELENGKLLWTTYTQGSDDVLLFDPEKTTSLGKPVGKDSSLKTWKGDQWKIGGGPTWWGWMSYDPELDLFYCGSGNPDTWNPVQRPGGNKWTMTIFARNSDTGVAKWVYQMTPHDHWDYDGVNEMILADIPVYGSTRALRSQWLRLHA